MDPKIIFPFAVNKDRNKIIEFTSVNKWGYNSHNKDYIDLSLGSCGCFPLGFHRYDFADTVNNQLKGFPHLSGEFLTTNEYVIELAEQLYTLSNGYRSIFTTSGSDAVETAIKVARHLQGKNKKILLGFENSYHGSTYLSQSIGGTTYLHEQYGRDENCISLPWDLDQAEEIINTLDGVCCLIVETCSWQNGLHKQSQQWWLRLKELCRQRNIIFIIDDIAFCGGKTGHFLGYDLLIEPDIVCIGKALTGGYYPLAGCLVSERLYDTLKETPFLHGFSYSFNMSGILSSLHYLEVIREECILENYHSIHTVADDYFTSLKGHEAVGDVRNYGLTWCLDLNSTNINSNSELLKVFLDHGLYLGLWNSHKQLLISVPNVLDSDYINQLKSRLSAALKYLYE
jgi:putrescine aminotransferase